MIVVGYRRGRASSLIIACRDCVLDVLADYKSFL